jgi:hypothetical protein
VITWLALLIACGDDPRDSTQTTPEEGQSVEESVDVLPVLSVDYPPRGAFQLAGSGTVQGTVQAGSAALTTVTVNGKQAAMADDGSFTIEIPLEPGIQLIGIRAEDAAGQRAVDGRAVYAGPVNQSGDWLSGALRFEIDSDILDDDDPEPDDIAALLEVLLEDPALLDLIVGITLEGSGFELTPTRVDLDSARVDLAAGDGVLEAEVQLNDVLMDFDVQGTGLLSWASTSGTAWIAAAQVGTDLTIVSSGGRIRTEAQWVEVDLVGYELTVDWFPDGLEDDLANWTEGLLEDTITEVAGALLGEGVSEALEGLVVDMKIAPGLGIAASLGELEIVPDALRMVVDTRLDAVSAFDLPPGAGALSTPGDPPEWPIAKGARIGVAVDDDFLNLLGFALWQAGPLSAIELPGVTVGGLSGEPIPPPLGPADSIEMGLYLPPVVSPPREADLFDADVSVGEWRIKFNREDGEVIEFSVNLRAGLRAEVLDGTELEVHLDNRPAAIDIEVGVLQSPEALDPGDLAALVRLMIPPLIGNSAELAPAIPIPTIPLGNLIDVDVVQDLELAISEPEMEFTEAGWLLLRADLEVL